MTDPLPVPAPNSTKGGIYALGYNAWSGADGLSKMLDALEAEGITILVDTRTSDYRGRYSYDQLAQAAGERQGITGGSMRFAARPALSGKPRHAGEYNDVGQADYGSMDQREDATHILDQMAGAARQGERIALLCACKGIHTCHRTRWLAESLAKRGVDVGHIEPGEYNLERHQEEGITERYTVTPHASLPDLPDHSDTNWQERTAYWQARLKPKPPPIDYLSPASTQPIPPQPRQVLIAGSMNANNAQLNYTSALVVRAAEVGAEIHVGDHDQGVDARVVATANRIGYDKVVVWTAGDEPRNGGVAGGQVRKVPYNYKEPGNRFTQRDRTMIRGLDTEQGAAFFFDHGYTHYQTGRMTGTEAGYVFAVEQGKTARKMSFGRPQDRAAELQPLPMGYTPPTPAAEPDAPPTSATPPASQPPSTYPTLSQWVTSLRQQRGLPDQSSLEATDHESVPPAYVSRKPASTATERWQAALDTAHELADQRRTHVAPHACFRGQQVSDLKTLPMLDLQGQALGYAVAGVDVRWQATPFKVNTEDWQAADTVSLLEIAHFREEGSAQTYAQDLTDFMQTQGLTDQPAQQRDFLRAVGQENRLPTGAYTTDLIRMGTTHIRNHRAEIAALQQDEFQLKTLDIGFRPMDYQPAPPEVTPLYDYSIHAVQTINEAGQPLGYSAIALRDVYANGVPEDSDIIESYALELARFEKQADAQQYSRALTQYIEQQDTLAWVGLPDQTINTQAFLNKLAEGNGLEVIAQATQHKSILGQGRFETIQNTERQPLQMPTQPPNFETIIDPNI